MALKQLILVVEGTQVAKQMVMQLGMSPEIGQRQLGGQQQGGPFMGRDFMGQGSPPMSQALKQQVDVEVKRIVDEQPPGRSWKCRQFPRYERGMKLLRDNMFLLDELAALLMEQEKVSGEELLKMINKAAVDGKLAMDQKQMAMAAYVGEAPQKRRDIGRRCLATAPATSSSGFCGGTLGAARRTVARLGLAAEISESTSEEARSLSRA